MAQNTPEEGRNVSEIAYLRQQFEKDTALSKCTILDTLEQDTQQYGNKYFYKECIKKLQSALTHEHTSDRTAAVKYASEEYEKEKGRAGSWSFDWTRSISQQTGEILADNTNEDEERIQLE